MNRMTMMVFAAAFATCAAPGHADSLGYGVIRYGNTSGWLFDNRDDHRDFPSNGGFPGNFAAQPSVAWIGAAGIAGTTPQRSVSPYPSQVVFGAFGSGRRLNPRK